VEVTTSCAKSQNDGHHVDVKRRPAVPVTLRLTREQLESAERLANRSGVRYQTVLKKLIVDGLRSWERAGRLKNWR
jgi:predicted DNA binding CopG/RHH family protein